MARGLGVVLFTEAVEMGRVVLDRPAKEQTRNFRLEATVGSKPLPGLGLGDGSGWSQTVKRRLA